jgi:hypothetical protein
MHRGSHRATSDGSEIELTTLDRTKIGFDRTIRAEWLDAVAARVSNGDCADAARKFIWDFLEDVEPGNTNNSGRGKTLTVLTRIWISVPDQAKTLRESALKQAALTSSDQRIAIHWAMCTGTHPFFFDVATHVGKLIRLHGNANRTQIKRRMIETWGDRSTVERTIQHVLRTLTQWGLLQAGPEYGSLVGNSPTIRIDENISQLLVHAILLGQGGGLAYSRILAHPALFPFKLDLSIRDLAASPAFHVHRQGDQSDFVEIAQPAQ